MDSERKSKELVLSKHFDNDDDDDDDEKYLKFANIQWFFFNLKNYNCTYYN